MILTFTGLVNNSVCHARTDAPAEILQFTAGGHVLGFMPDSFYMASGSHALKIEFVGTHGVKPVSDQVSSDVGEKQRVMPLTKVTYPDLWKGITLIYDGISGGVKSTYVAEPFADIGNIRLRYNVPVEIQADGSLRLEFESGYMSESPPVAWQELDGQKIPVKAAFCMVNDREVGFTAEYDPVYPLLIDPVVKWNTFMGNSSLKSIALDSKGNILMVGTTETSWGIPIHDFADMGTHAVVVKHDSNGNYVWHTFIGGPGPIYEPIPEFKSED